MDDTARVRAASRGAVDDITPSRLHTLLDTRLQNSSMAPGVLTLLSARVTSQEYDIEELARHAAGVQLIYEGLELTRTLSRSPPWEDDGTFPRGNMDILTANVLVARGFSVLAHTEAAEKAVETVQVFGQRETNHAAGRPSPDLGDRTLEADVFEMAIIAGTSAAGTTPPSTLTEFAACLAGSFNRELPTASELFSEPVVEVLADIMTGG